MLQPHDHVHLYVDDYLHDVLEPADAEYVEQHCAGCDACQHALDQARERLALLQTLPPREVSEGQIRTILEGVAGYVRRRRTLGRIFGWGTLTVTAASVAILSALYWYFSSLAPTPYDLVVLGQNQLFPGSTGMMSLRLTNRATGASLAKVPVVLTLHSKETGQEVSLGTFPTDERGIVQPRFQVPDWPDGSYELKVTARPDGKDDRLTQPIFLRRSWKLMLSSDKPVYQPGQTIHLRALALRRPDLKPVAQEEALFRITDPKGNLIFKKAAQTSAYGITAGDCLTATEIIEGPYTIACKLGNTESRLTVQVKKYVLPKFRIDVQDLAAYYQPGETVRGKAHGEYFFGGPVANGSMELEVFAATGLETKPAGPSAPRGQVIGRLTLRTDAQGDAPFEVALPKSLPGRPQDSGDARFFLQFKGRDTAGQEEQRTVSRLVTAHPLRVEVIPEGGVLVPGVKNTIYLFASYADGRPARVKIDINNKNFGEVTTDDQGVASFEVTPSLIPRDHPPGSFTYGAIFPTGPDAGFLTGVVKGSDEQGHTFQREFRLPCGQAAQDFLIRSDKAVYRGGETMKLTALGGGPATVFVDLIKDGQTLLSDTIAMQDGGGDLAIDLPPDLFGTIELCAYRLGNDGLAVRKTRVLYIEQARQLKIETKLDQPEYRPGRQAKLAFRLTDGKGQPVPGALSLAAVDEAVFSVLEQAPGMERTFYLLEQDLLKPVVAVYPWAPGRLPAEQTRPLEQALFARTAQAVAGSGYEGPMSRSGSARDEPPVQEWQPYRWQSPHSLELSSYNIKDMQTRRARNHGLDMVGFGAVLLGAFLVLVGYAAVWCFTRPVTILLVHLLLIPCLCLGVLTQIVILGSDAKMAFGGLTAEMKSDAIAARDGGSEGSGTIRVRENFPETLLWRPELITDDQGQATLDLDLADSITTWRLSASAVALDGRLGGSQTPIRVFQPFFVDLNLPVQLTRGDEVSVPVVVYNYLDKPQTVELTLAEADWFERRDEAVKTIELQAKEVRSTSYRLKVKKVGRHPLQVTAKTADLGDAIKRTVKVVPDGQKVEHVNTDRLNGSVTQTITIPEHAIPDSAKILVKLYPGVFSQVVEGIDGMLTQPFG